MDGHYVPNITFGPSLVKALAQETSAVLDVHLMVSDPDRYVNDFVQAGADYLTVHPETCPHLHRTLASIKELGCKAGVALNPSTGPAVLDWVWDSVDLILLMSVNPGFGGQRFIVPTWEKLKVVAEYRNRYWPQILVAVDGGVGPDNSAELITAGANVLVAGSALFGASQPSQVMAKMRCSK